MAEHLASEMDVRPTPAVRIIKESSTPLVGPGRPLASDSGLTPSREHLRRVLHTSRESLSDLRSVVRGGGGGPNDHAVLRNTADAGDGPRRASCATDEGMPTQRLAEEVDSLLALVESHTASST